MAKPGSKEMEEVRWVIAAKDRSTEDLEGGSSTLN
jgi:hypothetical protein